MAGGYTYYWSDRSDGHHAKGVAVAVYNKLNPMTIEVTGIRGQLRSLHTSVNERITRPRIHHSLCVILLVSKMLPVLLYGCETWILTKDLRQRHNFFGTRSLRRILSYCWSDFVSNEQFLRETQMGFVTCVVDECQLWLHGHVARFHDADPAQQIL